MATTLLGDSTSVDVWMRALRDADTSVWSRPVRSKKLDAAYAAVHGGSGQPFPDDPSLMTPAQLQHYHAALQQQQAAAAGQAAAGGMQGSYGGGSSRDSSPRMKRNGSGKVQNAVEAEGDLRAVGLCQKPTSLRTQEDIKFIQSYMCSLSYFFSLWPAPLQWELSRLLSAHILARREVALTRGRPPDRLYFVVQGRLDVRLPVPTPGGGREERTMAVLTRGHTVGEAVLLGAQAQHTTVVVSSSSAMLLSLSRPDFSRAFKEVLDIRQAERLMYLRLHPLLAGLPLRDLEAASEVLGLAFFPPGTRLWPLDEKERCLYFLAEGQAKVKRGGGGAAAAAGAGGLHSEASAAAVAAAEGTAATGPSMYDRFTISVLGPGDIFGLPSSDQALALQLQQSCAAAAAAAAANERGTTASVVSLSAAVLPATSSELPALHSPTGQPGGGGGVGSSTGPSSGGGAGGGGGGGHGATSNVVIESYSQVKVYYVRYSDYPRLPAAVQQVLQAANSFRWSYYEGRIVGLARMDSRRRDARREQMLRRGNVALQRRGGPGDGPLRSAAAAAALQLAERDRQLLNRVPILSASVAAGGGCAVSGAEQQAADARKAAQAAAAAQRERAKLQGGRRSPGGGEGDGEGEGEGEHYSRGEVRMPAWALPSGERGRLGGGGGLAGGGSPTGTESGALGGDDSPGEDSTSPQRGQGAQGRGRQAGGGGGGPRAGRAGSLDGGSASTAPGGLMSAQLHHSANAKALLAVQAAQLARVLEAEREQFAQHRRPVMHPREGGGGYEGDASGNEFADAPWAYTDSEDNSEEEEEDDADCSTPASRRTRRSRSRRRSPSSRRGPASPPARQPLTQQYLTCRAEPSPPHPPRVPLQPTLSLLPPSVTTFPRVQTFRKRQQPPQPQQQSPHRGQQQQRQQQQRAPAQHSPRTPLAQSSPRPQPSQQHSLQPGTPSSLLSAAQQPQQSSQLLLVPHSPLRGPRPDIVYTQPPPQPPPQLLATAEVVETEEPRSLIVTQSVRQRHVLLFQNAQALVAAASYSRPWIKPVRQPRPSYSRVSRTSQSGAPAACNSPGEGPQGGACGRSSPSPDSRLPPGRASSGLVLPLPLPRFSPGGSAALYDPSASLSGAASLASPLSARTASGGRRSSLRPDDRLSRYGSAGRASSAGGRLGGSGEVGAGGVPLLSGELPSPRGAFGRVGGAGPSPVAAPAGASAAGAAGAAASLALSAELSFAHLGVREVDDEDDSSAGGSSNGEVRAAGPGGGGGGAARKVPGGGVGGVGDDNSGGSGEEEVEEELDDAALLARVPAALLGREAQQGGHGQGAATPSLLSAPAPQHRLPPPHQQPQQGLLTRGKDGATAARGEPGSSGSGGGPGAAAAGASPGAGGRPAPSPSPSPAGPVLSPGWASPAGPAYMSSNGYPAGTAMAAAAGSGGAGTTDGLNVTMRRRAPGSAATAGAAAGPVPPIPAAAAAALAATSGGAASLGAAGGGGRGGGGASSLHSAGRSSSAVSAAGAGAAPAGLPRGPVDAEFPQDLDEKLLQHQHHHHHSHHEHHQHHHNQHHHHHQDHDNGGQPHPHPQSHHSNHPHHHHHQAQQQHLQPGGAHASSSSGSMSLPSGRNSSLGSMSATSASNITRGSVSQSSSYLSGPPSNGSTLVQDHMQMPPSAAAGGQQAGGGIPGSPPVAPPGSAASSSSSSQPVGLPPGIALGYESLDPFAWAALAAQVGPAIRTPFSQENILPKPQW